MPDFQRKPVADATAEELRQFARFMGLEVDSGAQKRTVLEKMSVAGIVVDEITVFEEVKPQATQANAGTFLNDKGKECYMIMIAEEDTAGGQEPVFVSVNGSAMLIPRGKDVPVPVEYVQVLRNAIEDIYDPVRDGLGGTRRPRKVPAYPFQIVPHAA